ncbi:LysR family transcriptional regulator [Litchfieldella qijiaojingensis]|uniref:LysR family transcriptional regulator n=1 Tax=Litchfieldella qijiaojingensis TaxID=980347 RepID=A0ABQ2YCT7_9GAMM|nr:LysR family transcriptional regulator [Halomonas qijiaojingensis]GGX79095.1 LysR family transcriptional regulator [Halomonas qijiaojingensis]
MEIRWLEDFIALARTRHFSRAADEQNVTQPTFSRRIKLLEEEMGATLVNRQTLPLSLTPAGEEFLRLCEQVTERVRLTRERLHRLVEEQAQRVLLAAPQSLLSYLLPDWLATYDLQELVVPYLRATSWLLPDYFQALERGECDLALCYWPVERCELELDTSAFHYQVIGKELLVPVSVADDSGRPRFVLPGSRRSPLPLMAYHPRGLLNAAITAHLARQPDATHFNVVNESIQTTNVKELIGLGYGVGWLPQRVAQKALDDGRLVRAGEVRWNVPLEIRLYRHRNRQHSGLEALWERLAQFEVPLASVSPSPGDPS